MDFACYYTISIVCYTEFANVTIIGIAKCLRWRLRFYFWRSFYLKINCLDDMRKDSYLIMNFFYNWFRWFMFNSLCLYWRLKGITIWKRWWIMYIGMWIKNNSEIIVLITQVSMFHKIFSQRHVSLWMLNNLR